MGNIEIKQQSPQKRRKSIFKETNNIITPHTFQKKQQNLKNSSNIEYSPIRSTSRKKQIFQSALTQRKLNTSRLNSSKFSNNKIYLHKNQQQTLSQSKKISNVRNVTQEINDQNYYKLSSRGQMMNIKKGKIVSNSRRYNNQNHKELTYHIEKSNTQFKRYQNTEIIKKVRNFNDFLNEIKQKLKQDKQRNIQRNKSRQIRIKDSNKKCIDLMDDKILKQQKYKNSIIDQNQINKLFQKQDSHKETRRLQVALKLQNQKLELEKYRKLVQRQLSKNHSIQSISLSTKKSGQRVLTIEYQNIINYQNNLSNKVCEQQQKWKKVFKQKSNNKQVKTKQKQKPRRIQIKELNNKDYQKKILQKLKNQYQNSMQNMIQLGKNIQMYEKYLQQKQLKQEQFQQKVNTFENQSFNFNKKTNENQRKDIFNQIDCQNQKINNIQTLFSKLTFIQDQFTQTDKEIKQILSKVQSNCTNDDVAQSFNSCKDSSYLI